MNITFDREKLLNALTILKGITRTKSNLQVTRTVRFTLRGMDAVLSANDLELAATTMVPIMKVNPTQDKPKVFLLHAGTLAEIIAEIKGQDIDIEIPDIIDYGNTTSAASKAVIRKGRIEIGLPIADPDDFPEIDLIDSDESFEIAAADFIRAVTRTLYASSNDESRYVLTGLYMQVKQGTFVMAGTDGFRIAISAKSVSEGGTSPHLVLPARIAKYMKETIDEHATIEVTLSEKKAQFVTNAVTIISRVIAEKYPDYESSLSGTPDGICFVRKADLHEALKRMVVLTKKDMDIVMIRRSRDGLRLDVETQSGYAKETLECRWRDDTPFGLEFRLKFLLDAVEHLVSDELSIQYKKSYAVIRIDEGESTPPDYIIGIMPIRGDKIPELIEDPDNSSNSSNSTNSSNQENLQQGLSSPDGDSAEATCEAHTLDVGGSNPPPATNTGKTEPETGSTGAPAKKHYRIKKWYWKSSRSGK